MHGDYITRVKNYKISYRFDAHGRCEITIKNIVKIFAAYDVFLKSIDINMENIQ